MSDTLHPETVRQSEKIVKKSAKGYVEKLVFPHNTQIGLESEEFQSSLQIEGSLEFGNSGKLASKRIILTHGAGVLAANREFLTGSVIPEDSDGNIHRVAVESHMKVLMIGPITCPDQTLIEVKKDAALIIKDVVDF